MRSAFRMNGPRWCRRTLELGLAASLTLLMACVAPRQPPPAVDVPTDWRSALAGEVRIESDWWRLFRDTQLSVLLEDAQSQNLTVAVANHRVIQARLLLASARAQQLPSADGAVSVQRTSGLSSESVSIGASYSLDLWGADRERHRGARARLEAVEASREVTIWRLQTQVAQLYFQRRALAESLMLAREALAIAEDTFKRVQARYDAGVISGLDLALVRTAVAQERTNVSAVQLAGDLARDAMGELLGRAPAQFVDADHQVIPLLETFLPPLPNALPAEVLARRPDIQVLEAQLRGADANIGLVRAQLLPQVSISTAGALALGGSDWLFSEGGNLAQAIFDGGQRQTAVHLAEAQYQELVENYRLGVIDVLVEVENAWVQVRRLAEREELDRAVLESAKRAYDLSDTRYQSGLVDALTLLSAQNNYLRSRDRLIQTRAAHLQALVALHAGISP